MGFEKRVVEEVSGWLRVFEDGSVDRTWTGPPEVKFMAEPVPAHEEFVDGVATRDVVTDPEAGAAGRVRVYLPEDVGTDPNGLPIILHFHGGGFCISRADWYMYYTIYTKLASSARAIVVSPYMRLAPENRLPVAIDDGFSALLWLRGVARGDRADPWLQAHGDFGRIFLIGDSSGGNIVHEVAARAGKADLKPARLAGAIPIHPGFMRSERSRSELTQPESPFLTLDMVDKFMGLSLPVGATKDHPITCPMGRAGPPLSGLNLPPFMLCLAEKDLITDTEMEYYQAMKSAGKDVELFISHGTTRSFYLNKIAIDIDPNTSAETDRLFSSIVEFIQKH